MASSKKNDVISVAPPHSIKKFELISEYVKAWINILMLNKKCRGIVYIDCMSNSGVYYDDQGNEIKGTPLLVSEIIAEAMTRYTDKQAYVYFNDLDSRKIDLLKTRIPRQTSNFTIYTESMDANVLLRKIGSQFSSMFSDMHFLLVYDPYDAHIEWDAMMPFLKNWGEIIINHMVSDTIRAAKMAKKPEVIEKYEEISDSMEIEIAKYLDQVSDAHLSDDTKAKIRAMLREISEIESIGDSCFNISRTIKRKKDNKEDFTDQQYQNIHQMFKLVDEALTQMNYMFTHDRHTLTMTHTFNIETEINTYRNQLRNQNLDDVDNHLYTYGIGTMYMDIIQECEKLGDYVVNVAEARVGVR